MKGSYTKLNVYHGNKERKPCFIVQYMRGELYCAVFCGAELQVLFCAMLCCTVLCSAVQCSAVQWSAVLCCAVFSCTVLSCTVLHCTAMQCTARHCTALHCTVLHCTALQCTALHCTVLYFAACAVRCSAVLYYALSRLCSSLLCSSLLCSPLLCSALHGSLETDFAINKLFFSDFSASEWSIFYPRHCMLRHWLGKTGLQFFSRLRFLSFPESWLISQRHMTASYTKKSLRWSSWGRRRTVWGTAGLPSLWTLIANWGCFMGYRMQNKFGVCSDMSVLPDWVKDMIATGGKVIKWERKQYKMLLELISTSGTFSRILTLARTRTTTQA